MILHLVFVFALTTYLRQTLGPCKSGRNLAHRTEFDAYEMRDSTEASTGLLLRVSRNFSRVGA
jgi:hypothetical protein